MIRKAVRKDWGHVSTGPRGVDSQSTALIMAPSSPPPERKSASEERFFTEDSDIVVSKQLYALGQASSQTSPTDSIVTMTANCLAPNTVRPRVR